MYLKSEDVEIHLWSENKNSEKKRFTNFDAITWRQFFFKIRRNKCSDGKVENEGRLTWSAWPSRPDSQYYLVFSNKKKNHNFVTLLVLNYYTVVIHDLANHMLGNTDLSHIYWHSWSLLPIRNWHTLLLPLGTPVSSKLSQQLFEHTFSMLRAVTHLLLEILR